jgi:hypothetical protein
MGRWHPLEFVLRWRSARFTAAGHDSPLEPWNDTSSFLMAARPVLGLASVSATLCSAWPSAASSVA